MALRSGRTLMRTPPAVAVDIPGRVPAISPAKSVQEREPEDGPRRVTSRNSNREGESPGRVDPYLGVLLGDDLRANSRVADINVDDPHQEFDLDNSHWAESNPALNPGTNPTTGRNPRRRPNRSSGLNANPDSRWRAAGEDDRPVHGPNRRSRSTSDLGLRDHNRVPEIAIPERSE